MTQQGAELQGYNNELVNYIEELRVERNELHRSILEEEEEKLKLENDIRHLTEHLAKVDVSLSKKKASITEFDKTIGETEGGYNKILKSSQTLLNLVKRESQSLKEKSHPAPGAPSQRNTH